MKPFTKQSLRRFFRHFFLASFLITFAVGHFIAENDTPTVSLKPVVTVPVNHILPINNSFSGSDLDFNDSSRYTLYNYHVNNQNIEMDYKFTFYIYNNILNCDFHFYMGEDGQPDDYSYEYLNIGLCSINSSLQVQDNITIDYSYNVTDDVFLSTVNISAYFGEEFDIEIELSDGYMSNVGSTTLFDETVTTYVVIDLLQYANEYYQNGYDIGFADGVNYVLNHLNEYNLYTQTQYLEYGQSEYQRGRNAGTQVLSVSDMIREIFKAPISMFKNAFNFVLPLPDGTSLNVGGILTFFLTIGIALTIVQLISKIGGK